MAGKLSGFLSKKNSGVSPGVNSSQSVRMSLTVPALISLPNLDRDRERENSTPEDIQSQPPTYNEPGGGKTLQQLSVAKKSFSADIEDDHYFLPLRGNRILTGIGQMELD